MFHTEVIGGNSKEIARTSGYCHGDLTHGRGALALAYAKMMQTAILIGEGAGGSSKATPNCRLVVTQIFSHAQ